jgi:hypothetical protein
MPIGFPPLVANVHPAESLRSAGVTPFHSYYGLLRLPRGPRWRYGFRQHVWAITPPARASQVPGFPFGTRRPLSPRKTRWTPMLVVHPPATGFTTLRRAGRLHLLCNEAETGSLALRLMPSTFGASALGLRPRAARWSTWRTSKYHGNYLSSCKESQAWPDAPETQRTRRFILRVLCVSVLNNLHNETSIRFWDRCHAKAPRRKGI